MSKMNKSRKLFATTATAALVASAIVPVASAAAYTDADKIAPWAKEAVEFLSAQEVIGGNPDGSFNPQGNIIRAEAAKMFATALELSEEGTENFSDVSAKDWFYGSVVAVSNAGIVTGKGAGVFAPKANLSRAEAAKMIVKAYGLTGEADLSKFADAKNVSGKWSEEFLSTAVANGVINGKDGKLAAGDSITRQEFAVMFKRAIDAAAVDFAAELTEALTALDKATKALDAEVKIETIEASKTAVATAKTAITTAQTALDAAVKAEAITAEVTTKATADIEFSKEAVKKAEAKIAQVEEAAKAPVVEAVTAVNPSTLKVTGSNLGKLKATDVTVAGNVVSSYVVAEDGKSATVTVNGKLLPDTEYTVKVSDKEFKVKYVLKADTVTVTKATFDDDRAEQKVTLKLDGQDVDADYLKALGYSVTFTAINPKTNVAAPIFATKSSTSTSGKLDTGLTKGDYEVQVSVSKDGVAVVSAKETITIANIDAATSAINEVQIANGATNADYNGTLTGADFVMNSSTLVAGDTAAIYKLKATVNGVETTVPYTSLEVKSSNPAIISVDNNGILTANGDGTATITVKVGKVEKAITLTVSSKARELTKVTTDKSTLSVINGGTASVTFKTFDQYGDPFAVIAGSTGNAAIVEEIPTVDGNPIVSGLDIVTDTANSIGEATINITADKSGKETVIFRENKSNKVIGSLFIDSTVANTVATKKVELVKVKDQSVDNNLDLADTKDKKVTYKVSKYNNVNQYVGVQGLENYTLEVVDGTIASVQFHDGTNLTGTASTATANASKNGASGDTQFVITGLKSGKTDVLVKDTNGALVEKLTVTVANGQTEVQSVTFKSVPKVDYIGEVINLFDVLDTVKSTGDDIVNGVTLSKPSQAKIRLVETAKTAIDKSGVSRNVIVGDLYLDEDNNAIFSNGDVKLGSFTASATSDSNFSVDTTKLLDTTDGLVKTVATNKGTVLFKLTANLADGTTKAITSAVTVDVK